MVSGKCREAPQNEHNNRYLSNGKNTRQQQTVFPGGEKLEINLFFSKLRAPVNCLLLLCFWRRKKIYSPRMCVQRRTHARTEARQAEMGKMIRGGKKF